MFFKFIQNNFAPLRISFANLNFIFLNLRKLILLKTKNIFCESQFHLFDLYKWYCWKQRIYSQTSFYPLSTFTERKRTEEREGRVFKNYLYFNFFFPIIFFHMKIFFLKVFLPFSRSSPVPNLPSHYFLFSPTFKIRDIDR